jgi:hypothetical protein
MIRFKVRGAEGSYDLETDTWTATDPWIEKELRIQAKELGRPYDFPSDPEMAKVIQVVVRQFGGEITDPGERPEPVRWDLEMIYSPPVLRPPSRPLRRSRKR